MEIAKQVLHRRNASIFDAHVIKPLAEGKRHPPVEETARQFNVTPKRIYKIIDKCWQKVREAVPRFLEGRRLDGEQQSSFCDICGRHESSSGLCARGGYGVCSRPLPWRFRYLPKITAEEALRKPTKEEALQVEKWIRQERTERTQRAKEWQDYLIKTFEHWEANYGPGRKPQLSEFFSSPRRKGK
ncbi:MAG: hypothetical protein WAK55_34210 [Xanthobacteraceae bacterium]